MQVNRGLRQFGLSLAAFGLLGVWAFSAEIVDNAGLFTAEAVQQAKASLSAIEKQAHHGVRIETYATVPNNKAESLKAMSPSERDKFYAGWLKDRAQSTKAEGLFVLISKDPSHLQVGVSSSLQKAGFTKEQKQAIITAMTTAFKEKDFDRGLKAAVASVESSYGGLQRKLAMAPNAVRHERGGAVAPAPVAGKNDFGVGSLIMIAVLVVGGLLLVSVIGRMMSGAMGAGGAGGGGFFGSLLGGMAGIMAGHWIYDSFFNHNAHAGDTSSGTDGFAGGETWDSSGADYGDSGGSDFGGGDFGGGDW